MFSHVSMEWTLSCFNRLYMTHMENENIPKSMIRHAILTSLLKSYESAVIFVFQPFSLPKGRGGSALVDYYRNSITIYSPGRHESQQKCPFPFSVIKEHNADFPKNSMCPTQERATAFTSKVYKCSLQPVGTVTC